MMRVDQVMSDRVFVCRATDDATAAAAIMWEHDCGAVPVVDEAGRLVGMVTDRDLCMAAFTRGQPVHALPVASVMQSTVYACRKNDRVDDVQTMMVHRQVRRIPVVDEGGRPIAMVSLIDLARHALLVGPSMPERMQALVRALVGVCNRHQQSPARAA
jgi:CBS domain-containing protein